MLQDDRFSVFQLVHERWAAGDLKGVLELFSEDNFYLVNVDGLAVPFASSSLGKDDVRQSLQLIGDIFHQEIFELESFVEEADHIRSVVNVHNIHKKTGEHLRVRLRLLYWIEDGLIVRANENLDAPHIEDFQRFVFHMENAARSA